MTSLYGSYKPSPGSDIREIWSQWDEYNRIEPDQAKIIRILRADKACEEAAEAIAECSKRSPCNISACRKCFSETRRFVVSETLRLFSPYPDKEMNHLTIISKRDQYRAEELTPDILTRATNRLAKITERAELEIVMIGGTDLNYDVRHQVYQLHHHLIGRAVDTKNLAEALRGSRSYQNTDAIHTPVMETDIKNRPKQFSYVFKSIQQRKERWVTDENKQESRMYGMKRTEMAAWVTFTAQLEPLDLLVLIGARRDNTPKIEPTRRGFRH